MRRLSRTLNYVYGTAYNYFGVFSDIILEGQKKNTKKVILWVIAPY
jgi:hypothetical protein